MIEAPAKKAWIHRRVGYPDHLTFLSCIIWTFTPGTTCWLGVRAEYVVMAEGFFQEMCTTRYQVPVLACDWDTQRGKYGARSYLTCTYEKHFPVATDSVSQAVLIGDVITCLSLDYRQRYFGEINNVPSFYERTFFKEREDTSSRSARLSTSYVHLLDMLKRKGFSIGTVQYLGRDHRPTPDAVTPEIALYGLFGRFGFFFLKSL